MSDPATRSELSQVLDEIKAMRADMKAMQTQLYDLTLEVRTNQATTAEKFNTLEEKINAVRTELKTEIQSVRAELKAVDEKVTDLSDRQRVVDSRLWGFIVALVGAIIAYLVKLSFFDKV